MSRTYIQFVYKFVVLLQTGSRLDLLNDVEKKGKLVSKMSSVLTRTCNFCWIQTFCQQPQYVYPMLLIARAGSSQYFSNEA